MFKIHLSVVRIELTIHNVLGRRRLCARSNHYSGRRLITQFFFNRNFVSSIDESAVTNRCGPDGVGTPNNLKSSVIDSISGTVFNMK